MSKTADVYIIREHENSVLTWTIPEQTRLSLFTRPSARLSSILGRRIGTRSPPSLDSRPTYFRAVLHIDQCPAAFYQGKGWKETVKYDDFFVNLRSEL